MSTDSNYAELAINVDYYRTLLQLIEIHPMSNGWINWRISTDWELQQIQLENNETKKRTTLSAKEWAIVTIAFCEWFSNTPEQRLLDQEKIMRAWIVTISDIIQSTRDLIWNIKWEHLASKTFLKNSVENSAKICLARNSYNSLARYFSENPERLNDPEAIILLAYVIIILWYRFELRPYMINPWLLNVDWVTILDSMFWDFSNNNKALYVDKWYHSIWEAIKKARDDIFHRKESKKEAVSLIGRASSGVDVRKLLNEVFTQSPPLA